jgi:hypothetical protein
MDSIGSGVVTQSVSDEIGVLVKKGYETWQAFDEEYKANAERIESVSAGGATWSNVATFLRRYCGADEGPRANLTSLAFLNDEIVDIDEELPTVSLNGDLFLCGDTGGLSADTIAGQKVRQLGLNLPEVVTVIRRFFQTEQVCGAGYLNRPAALDHRYGSTSFGVLSFLRQTIRYEGDRVAEERLSLHSYIIVHEDVQAINAKQQAELLRLLADSSRVQNPVKTEL